MSVSRRRLSSTVVALGVVSLLTDLSSEMIYPLLPVFLVSVLGAGAVALGVVEGVAESAASLLKVVSGRATDRTGRRKPLVVAGYGLSSVAKPLIGAAVAWPWVAGLRFVDRVGKGLRTFPRDALIADVSDESSRGAAYGLHRAMDHAGAVAGPLIAAGLLLVPGIGIRQVFYMAAIPGAAVLVVLWLGVREPRRPPSSRVGQWRRRSAWTAWSRPETDAGGSHHLHPGQQHRRFPAVAFLRSRRRRRLAGRALGSPQPGPHGLDVGGGPMVGSGRPQATHGRRLGSLRPGLPRVRCHHGTRPAAGPVPRLRALLRLDRTGGTSMGRQPGPPSRRGAAFGWYHGAVGVAALPASVLFGVAYTTIGPAVAFGAGAALAAAGVVVLVRVPDRRPLQTSSA